MGATRTQFRGSGSLSVLMGPTTPSCAVLCCALQVPGSLTSSMVDDVFFILKKSSSRALATQVGGLLVGTGRQQHASLLCHDRQPVCVVCPPDAGVAVSGSRGKVCIRASCHSVQSIHCACAILGQVNDLLGNKFKSAVLTRLAGEPLLL